MDETPMEKDRRTSVESLQAEIDELVNMLEIFVYQAEHEEEVFPVTIRDAIKLINKHKGE